LALASAFLFYPTPRWTPRQLNPQESRLHVVKRPISQPANAWRPSREAGQRRDKRKKIKTAPRGSFPARLAPQKIFHPLQFI
jgi:hypothetical protein